MIEIKNSKKETVLETFSGYIHEAVFDQIVDMIYNDDDPYSGMSPNEEYLLDKQDIDYCIRVCKCIIKDEDFEDNEEAIKIINTLENIGDECYIKWVR